jgi:outer membrane murein-binding lipoprotein Lpp
MRTILAAVTCACAVALAGCCIDYDQPRATASIRHTAAKPAMSEADRIRASQAKQCAQRHVDRANGILDETMDQKRDKDAICGAFYKGS